MNIPSGYAISRVSTVNGLTAVLDEPNTCRPSRVYSPSPDACSTPMIAVFGMAQLPKCSGVIDTTLPGVTNVKTYHVDFFLTSEVLASAEWPLVQQIQWIVPVDLAVPIRVEFSTSIVAIHSPDGVSVLSGLSTFYPSSGASAAHAKIDFMTKVYVPFELSTDPNDVVITPLNGVLAGNTAVVGVGPSFATDDRRVRQSWSLVVTASVCEVHGQYKIAIPYLPCSQAGCVLPQAKSAEFTLEVFASESCSLTSTVPITATTAFTPNPDQNVYVQDELVSVVISFTSTFPVKTATITSVAVCQTEGLTCKGVGAKVLLDSGVLQADGVDCSLTVTAGVNPTLSFLTTKTLTQAVTAGAEVLPYLLEGVVSHIEYTTSLPHSSANAAVGAAVARPVDARSPTIVQTRFTVQRKPAPATAGASTHRPLLLVV